MAHLRFLNFTFLAPSLTVYCIVHCLHVQSVGSSEGVTREGMNSCYKQLSACYFPLSNRTNKPWPEGRESRFPFLRRDIKGYLGNVPRNQHISKRGFPLAPTQFFSSELFFLPEQNVTFTRLLCCVLYFHLDCYLFTCLPASVHYSCCYGPLVIVVITSCVECFLFFSLGPHHDNVCYLGIRVFQIRLCHHLHHLHSWGPQLGFVLLPILLTLPPEKFIHQKQSIICVILLMKGATGGSGN